MKSRNDSVSRRAMLGASATAVGAAVLGPSVSALLAQTATPASPTPSAPPDATAVPGLPSGPLGERSPFEHPALAPTGVTTGSTYTPLQDLSGTITPADLHFQRHHNGIAIIDPARYELVVHGMVDKPVSFSLEDLRRFPAVSRVYFVECSGNGRAAYRAPKPAMTAQMVDGLTSNSEWTGVPVSALLREAGVRGKAEWVLAEGGDAAVLSRSIPMEKMQDDAIVAYAQNGEPLRVANGYPARLLLPGYEGNTCVKWLRRLKVIDQPNMSRDETSKYTDPLPDGKARQFSFVMDAKSVITSPTTPARLSGPGWWPVSGIAWTGRGRIARVDVSTDGGRTWSESELLGPVQPMAHTRFQHLWKWDGRPTSLMSRAMDETGYQQPTRDEFTAVRGLGTDFHFNSIRTWLVGADGLVQFGG